MLKNAIWIFAVTLLILIFFLPAFTAMQDKKQKNLKYQEQIRQLHDRSTELTEEKRLLEEDPDYLEKVAREKMGIVREGEFVYRLTPMNKEE
jgi:cell division protein FtsB